MGTPIVSARLVWLVCLFGTLTAGAATAAQRYAVIINGASGGEKYAAQQKTWRSDLTVALKNKLVFPPANIVVFAEDAPDSVVPTAENVRKLFTELRRRVTRDDLLMIVLIGHGTYDGVDAKFNLVGPDLTAAEWNSMLDGVPGQMILVNTTESSFPFLEALSRRGRVVITATDTPAQRFATVFPEYFAQAIGDLASDLDKNGRISIWEAFRAASSGVRTYYEQRGQLSTERPVLDDNGDGKGREAGDPGPDGTVALGLFLDAEPGSLTPDAELASLYRRRAALEEQIEALKNLRSLISQADYDAQLEQLLIQLSRIAQQIRQGS